MVQEFVALNRRIWTFPIGRRIAAYALVWAGAILFLASLAVCLLAVWVLLTTDAIPNILDNPPAEEWDIR